MFYARITRIVLVIGLAIILCVPAQLMAETNETQSNSMSISNSLGMNLMHIPSGVFRMGSGKDFNDQPTHEVTISQAYYMSQFEVTQAQFTEIMGYNPSWIAYGRANYPVDCVSWFEAVEFCQQLSKREGKSYRLPTEAEWEYAAKAGTGNMWYFEGDADAIPGHAWINANTKGYLQPVGGKPANPWGLHDMLGNAYEWCSDWLDHTAYTEQSQTDPQGPDQSANLLGTAARVTRGGNVLGRVGINALRTPRASTTARNGWTPTAKPRAVGFRVVLETSTPSTP